jgi:hypothetical protein
VIVAAILIAAVLSNVIANVRFPALPDVLPVIGIAVWIVILAAVARLLGVDRQLFLYVIACGTALGRAAGVALFPREQAGARQKTRIVGHAA